MMDIMIEMLHDTITAWNQRTTDRQKLQHVYMVLITIVVFVAGFLSLINADRSRQLMYVALAFLITLVINFVTWSLLKTSLLDKLPKRSSRR